MRALAVPLMATALLAACSTPPAPPPAAVAPQPGGDCRMAAAQFAVGRHADASLQAEATRRAGAQTLRVLRPNQVMTMEFNAQRLNLEVDASNRVVAVRCG